MLSFDARIPSNIRLFETAGVRIRKNIRKSRNIECSTIRSFDYSNQLFKNIRPSTTILGTSSTDSVNPIRIEGLTGLGMETLWSCGVMRDQISYPLRYPRRRPKIGSTTFSFHANLYLGTLEDPRTSDLTSRVGPSELQMWIHRELRTNGCEFVSFGH